MPKTQPNPGAVAITSFIKNFVPAYAQRKMQEAQAQAQAKQKQTPRDEILDKLANDILTNPDSPQAKIDWATNRFGIDNYPKQQQTQIGGTPDYLYKVFPKSVQEDIAGDTINPNTGSPYYTPDKRLDEEKIKYQKQQTKTSKALENQRKAAINKYSNKTPQYLNLQRQIIGDQLKAMVDSRGNILEGFEDDYEEKTIEMEALNEAVNKKTGAVQPSGKKKAIPGF